MEVYRLDLAWPEHRIALEYNGYAVHVGREVEDERRAKDLRRRGWIVVIATSDDLADSRVVEQKLRAAFTQRGFRWPVC
jgi:very-short-patch-repair endonuclease